jgi:hypothetical protein
MKSSSVWFGILALPSLNGLRRYYSKSESLLKSAAVRDKKRIAELSKSRAMALRLDSEEEYAEWSLMMQSHETTYEMLYTNFLRYSFVI